MSFIAPVRDTFDRADAGNLGANWTDLFGGLDIVGNAAAAPSAAPNLSYWNVAQFSADCEVYDTISTLPADGTTCVLLARMQNVGSIATLDCYGCTLSKVAGAGNDTITLSIITNGVGTPLGSTITQEFSAGDKYCLRIIGSTLYALRESGGVETVLGTRTDATYSAGGYAGLVADNTTVRLNDFGAGGVIQAAGTSSITFTPAATLAVSKALAAASTIVFTPNGALSLSKALAGTAALLFTPIGALTIQKVLVGSSTISFAPTGALTLQKLLAGSTAVTFSVAGILTVAGQPLQGTIQITFAANGAVSVGKTLTGNASIAFTPAGSAQVAKALTGSTTLTFNVAGRLVGGVFIGGNPRIVAEQRNQIIEAALRPYRIYAILRPYSVVSESRNYTIEAATRPYTIYAPQETP